MRRALYLPKWLKFSFVISALMSHSILVNANVASGKKNSKIVYQIEAGFNLTLPLANKIKNQFKKDLTAQKRADYYIDIYNGEKLLISESIQDYKVRLKAKKDKWVLQANTKLSVQTHSCSDGTNFKVREKNVGELKLSETEAGHIIKTVAKSFDLIANQKPNEFSESIKKFDEFLNSLTIPLFDQVLEVTNNEKWIIVPTHYSKKIKWSSSKEPKTKIEWSLTEAQDYLSSKFIESKYEIEFQTEEHSTSIDDFAAYICDFMSELNASADDLTPDRKDVDAIVINQLAQTKDILEYHK